jgi:hypothetical protein
LSRERKWVEPVLWALFFFWLDVFPFRGWLGWLAAPDYILAYFLAVTFYYDGVPAVALAIGMGMAADAFSGTAVHTPVFVGSYYVVKLLKGVFYKPGSPFHIISYLLPVAGANLILYGMTWAGGMVHVAPAVLIVKCTAVDFPLFLAMLLLFRKHEQPRFYKIAR